MRLPNDEKLLRELRLLERRTGRSGKDTVDHPRLGSDDRANVVAGVVDLCRRMGRTRIGGIGVDGRISWRDDERPRASLRVVHYSEAEALRLKEKGLW